VISFGSSAIPQIGQLPGPIWTISGCIGQVNSIWDLGSGISDFVSDPVRVYSCEFVVAFLSERNDYGSAGNRSLHRTAQK